MPTLNELLNFECKNEHRDEHSLLIKKLYPVPKLYTASYNIKNHWFVYYHFRNPKTGLLQRMKNIYGNANRYATKEERLSLLSTLQKYLHKLLKEGLSYLKTSNTFKSVYFPNIYAKIIGNRKFMNSTSLPNITSISII